MNSENLHYELVDTRARPARIAVLLDSSDAEWQHSAARIIELLSSIWGGQHSVIVPTDGASIDPVFWEVLEAFSPDYVYFYRKTGLDLKFSNPEQFKGLVDKRLALFEGSWNLTEEQISKDIEAVYVGSFGLSRGLCSQIANRLVPFHFKQNFEPIVAASVPHSLTKVVDLFPYVERPQTFMTLEVPPVLTQIWWMAHTGAYTAALSRQLQDLGIAEHAVTLAEGDLGRFSSWIATGMTTKFPDDAAQDPRIPFVISASQVALYGSPVSARDHGNRFAVVVGDSVADFCLSYCLPRVGYRTAWLPARWLSEIQANRHSPLSPAVRSLVWAAPHTVRSGRGVSMCSQSLTSQQLAASIEFVQERTDFGLNGEKSNLILPIDMLREDRGILMPYCIDSPNQSEIYPFLGDRSAGAIRTPRPNRFSSLSAAKHRWIAEIATPSRPLPSVPHIAETLTHPRDSSGAHHSRITKQSLAYFCPSPFMTYGDDINSNLRKIEISLFDTFDAVSSLASNEGYKCRLSDKGIYQRDSFEKFGGASKAAALLRGGSTRKILMKFIDHTKPPRGVFDEGCVLADKRTYLDFAAAQKQAGGDGQAAGELLDSLVSSKILYRGFLFACGICKHAAWYSLKNISDSFRCLRCDRDQTISRRHWRHPSSPQIFYKMDEIVYQFLKSDGDVVALGLDYMARKSSHPFSYSHEVEFLTKDGALYGEIDLAAVYRGVLMIGEAKKDGRLDSSTSEVQKILDKYIRISEMLSARCVLFCTSDSQWSAPTIDAINRAFQGRLAQPEFATEKELFS